MISFFLFSGAAVLMLFLVDWHNQNKDDDPPASNGQTRDPLQMLEF